ncbi:MAG TPA: DUF2089 family protein [Candidatus Hydrogenedentes bacterium]|nr:DUF2089 family protein [Candidatus Hydrogenedentota bacterium]HPG66272.1 DUF2089 family protein [Candidatus Hydrogenedentota bacterium]
MGKRLLPVSCPSCGQVLKVKRFACPACDTAVEGDFALPVLARLSPEEQEFLVRFAECSGSLKDMARRYGVSYPTVRNRLDALIDRLGALKGEGKEHEERSPS